MFKNIKLLLKISIIFIFLDVVRKFLELLENKHWE